MTIGINTSPLAGLDGTALTARLVKNRLDAEVVGNVSIRVMHRAPRHLGGAGARRAQLAVLVDDAAVSFELTVGKPQVLARDIGWCTSRSTASSTCPRSSWGC